jgi:hypothetical protein
MRQADGLSRKCNTRKGNTSTAMLQGRVGARLLPINDGREA